MDELVESAEFPWNWVVSVVAIVAIVIIAVADRLTQFVAATQSDC